MNKYLHCHLFLRIPQNLRTDHFPINVSNELRWDCRVQRGPDNESVVPTVKRKKPSWLMKALIENGESKAIPSWWILKRACWLSDLLSASVPRMCDASVESTLLTWGCVGNQFLGKDDSAASVLLETGLLEPSKFPPLPENPPKATDFHSSVLTVS